MFCKVLCCENKLYKNLEAIETDQQHFSRSAIKVFSAMTFDPQINFAKKEPKNFSTSSTKHLTILIVLNARDSLESGAKSQRKQSVLVQKNYLSQKIHSIFKYFLFSTSINDFSYFLLGDFCWFIFVVLTFQVFILMRMEKVSLFATRKLRKFWGKNSRVPRRVLFQ